MHRILLSCVLAFGLSLSNVQAAEGERPEIFVQLGHADLINAVAYSRDGRQVLSGSNDNTLKLWDVASGREIRTYAGHTARVTTVAISPDGTQGLSGSDDKTIRLWDLASGRVIRTFTGDPKTFVVASVAFSPDGRTALSGGSTLVLWDLASGTPRTLQEYLPGALLQSVAFSPDGRQALSAQLLTVASGGWGFDSSLKFKQTFDLKLWDVASGRELRTLPGHTDVIRSVVFSADGRQALSGGRDRNLRLWDLATGNVVQTFSGHEKEVRAVAFSPDGRSVISGSDEGAVVLWDIATGKPVRGIGVQPTLVTSIAVSPDGTYVLSAGASSMTLWNVPKVRAERTLAAQAGPIPAVAVGADLRRLLSAGFDGQVKPWDGANGKRGAIIGGNGAGLLALAVSRDGHLAVTGGIDKTVRLWELASGREIAQWSGHHAAVSSVAFSPDGTQVLSGSWDFTLMLWDVAGGKRIRTLTGHRGPVNTVAFSADGKQAMSGDTMVNGDSALRWWDLASGSELRASAKPDAISAVRAVAYSPDGKLSLSATYMKQGVPETSFLKLHDAATGNEIRRFTGHTNEISAAAFSPDGRQALSGGRDNTVKLWDVATGRVLQTLTGHAAEVKSVVFSPDGLLAISGSADSTTRVWDLASGRELVRMISFYDGEWLSITPEGYFSASSPKAADNLGVRRGQQVYSINQFFDVFYRPDIVEAALSGKGGSRLAALTLEEATRNPPPVVENVSAPAATPSAERLNVAYRIKSTGGGIGEVRVFHNGKLVSSDGAARSAPDALLGRKASQITGDVLAGQMRSLAVDTVAVKSVTTVAAKPDVVDAAVEIEPIPGENEITVLAFNAQNSVQSVSRTFTFTSTKAPAAPRLFVLSIGIDQYRDKSSTLKYAVKDARDLGARWQAQAANIYGAQNITVETLVDAKATRAGILAKIDQIAARVKPTDHFLLFIASHGVLLGDQYYMVTNDYDGVLTPAKMISSNEIVDFSKRIKALSQLYILDTCHAGGMGGVVSGLYDARVSVLAKKMGLHIFASASSAEEALDGFEGNGLFTHTLLAGLDNNPRADANTDRQVSLTELGTYSKGQTRDIATRMKHKQDPLIINFGQDNPVYRLR